MSKTLSGTYAVQGYTLSGASQGALNPVTVTGSIAIGAGAIPAALYAQGPGAWTITNLGTITGGAVAGIELAAGGSILNAQYLTGHFGISVLGAQGSVTNSGTILAVNAGTSATANRAIAVMLAAGGQVTNQINAQITGQGAGVEILGGAGTVTNSGTIDGPSYEGVYLSSGNVTNLGTAASITGGTIGSGGSIGTGGSVVNSGWGVVIRNGGTLSNDGFITGIGQGGALLGGGYINNDGTIHGVWGVAMGALGTVVNSGLLDGTSQSGAYLSGGSVTNQSGGRIVGLAGVVIRNAAATVVNSGLIEATSPSGYGVFLGGGFADRLVDNPGASFIGVVDGGNTVGASAISTLELGSATSQGTLNGLGSQFINFAAVTIDPGASWSMTGVNSLVVGASLSNQGSLALNGALLVNGVLTSAGPVTVATSASIVASATVTGGGNWADSGTLTVADSGVGSFLVDGTATVSAAAAVLGASVGGAGTFDVTGPGARFSAAALLTLGSGGSGTLTIQNGGTVLSGTSAGASAGLDLGAAAGGKGDVTVSGVNSFLGNNGEFVVGELGRGGLTIDAGGAVNTTPGSVSGLAGMVIANTASASGSSLDVSAGFLTVAGSLVVGNAGFGSLSLAQGASVTAGSLDLAAASSGDGVVSVVGVGTSLTVTGSLVIGDQSSGEMSILGGAAVMIGGGLDNGNLDVEGSGSHLTINGGTLVVGQNGPAIYTLGQGTTQTGAERTAAFGIANLGGLQDPPYLTNDSPSTTLTSGYVGEADIAVRNSGTYTVQAANGTFAPPTIYAADVSFDPNSAQNNGNTNGAWVIQALGTLVLNAATVDASQTVIFQSANAARLVIGQVPQTSSTLDPDGAPTITGSMVPGSPNVLPNFAAPIQNYQAGDVIALAGLTYGSATASGDVVTVWSGVGGQGTALGSLTFLDKHANSTGVTAAAEATAAATQITALACFVEGTRIGDVAVEALRVGDLIQTADGRREAIIWIGHRHVDCARHPDPETVWPVRVARGAFGRNVPMRDLYLSPDHAVFVDGVLVPAKLLVNGTSIAQEERNRVTYYHVELARHEVILAEQLPCESYLDLGDRANFDGRDTIRLFPDFAAKLKPDTAMVWETRACAKLVVTGPKLDALRRLILRAPLEAVGAAEPTSRSTPG